jgi:hypothetical protein
LTKNLKFSAVGAVLGLAGLMSTTSALAECTASQDASVGKVIAEATSERLSAIIDVNGKQVVDIKSCDEGGADQFKADFRYRLVNLEGVYWVEGKAEGEGASVTKLSLYRVSPSVQTAEAKAGTRLALKN